MPKQTTYFSLTGKSEVARLHRKEVGEVGLLRAKNFYVSASDGALTLRGDINRFRDDIPTFSDHWQIAVSGDNFDFLNTLITTGDSGSDIYIERMFPARPDVMVPLCDTYAVGTVTTDGAAAIVTGSGTEFVKYVHGHAFIQFSTDAELYRIASVESNTILSLDVAPGAYASAAYTIYLTHDTDRALWPMHFEMYGQNYLYAATSPQDPDAADLETISGPFKLVKQDEATPTVGVATASLPLIPKIRYINSKFFACAMGKVLESSDGVTWVERPIAAGVSIQDITWSGSAYLAVGKVSGPLPAVYMSSDGIAWVECSVPSNMAVLNGVAYGASVFVLVSLSSPDSNSHVLWYTADGVTFTQATNPGAPYGYANVDFVNSLFVATLSSVAVTSADGITWTSATIGNVGISSKTIWDGSQYACCGVSINRAAIATSADAVTWVITTPASLPYYSAYDIDFIAGPTYVISGHLTQAGITTSYIHSSADLATWTLESNLSLSAPRLATNGTNLLVALFGIANNSAAQWYYSTDGTTWTQTDAFGQAVKITSFGFVDPNYWIVTDKGGVFYSSGGTSYSSVGSGTANDLNGFVHGSIYYVAVGASGTILSATDPNVWTAQVSGVATDLYSVCYSSSLDLFVAVGENGTVVTSSDTVTWADHTIAIAGEFLSVCWDDTIFTAVGTGGIIYTSANGTAWTSRTSGVATDLNGVAGIAALIVAVGDGGVILTSPTGTTWTPQTSGTAVNLWAVARCNTRWVACGETGKILRSSDAVTWANVASGTSSTLYAVLFDDYNTWLAGAGLVVVRLPQTAADSYFESLSDLYRSNDFTVCDGYTVLVGTSELEGGDWVYHNRRVRWTSPGTIGDFSEVGSGAADLNGTGHLLTARTLGHNVVIWESGAIGVLSQTGETDAPWTYRRIVEGVQLASNPCVVDDKAYFVDQNGLIQWTNGIEVAKLGSPFDLTWYTDLGDTLPVWLVYRKSINCLLVYKPDASSDEARVFVVHIDSGTTTSLDVPVFPASSDSTGNFPRAVVQIVAAYPTFPQARVGELTAENITVCKGITVRGDSSTSGGTLVTVGDNYSTWSTNGLTWHTVVQTKNLTSVEYNSVLSQWCAVGHDGAILTSTNGKTWTDRSLSASTVVFTNTRTTTEGTRNWVAVGRSTEETSGDAVVYSSDDGVTWADVSPTGLSGITFNDICWDGSVYAIGCQDDGSSATPPLLYSSADLSSYTLRQSGDVVNQSIAGVDWNGTDTFCAGGWYSVYASPDAVTWTKLDPWPTDHNDYLNLEVTDVYWNGAAFLLCGWPYMVSYNTDGTGATQTWIYDEIDVYQAIAAESVFYYDNRILIATGSDIGVNTPYIALQVRATDESAWRDAGDSTGTISVTTTACVGTGTAWSNVIAMGDDSTVAFTLPCLATQARIYIDDTARVLDTDYTITDTKEITFVTAPAGDQFVIAYWENEPCVRMQIGDMIKTDEGLHKVIAIPSATSLRLQWYPSETLVGTHLPAKQAAEEEGETVIGLNCALDALQAKVYAIPFPHPISGWGLTTETLGVAAGSDLCILGYEAAPSPNTDKLLTARIGLEHPPTGIDSFANLSTYRERWWGEIQTGETEIVSSGNKASVKEFWVRTYCGTGAEQPNELLGFSVVHVPSGPRVLKATR